MIGEHEVALARRAQRGGKTGQQLRARRGPAASCPSCAVDLREDRPAEPTRPAAQIHVQQARRPSVPSQQRRQRAPHVGDRRERRDDQRHRRDDRLVCARRRATSSSSTANPCRPESQCRAPGTAPCRPRAPRRTAQRPRRVRRRRPSSWPTAGCRRAGARSAARMFVTASATAMRAAAAGSSSASGVRSPIAIASPATCWIVATASPRRRPPAPARARPSGRG